MKQQLLKDNELKRKKTGKFIEDDDEEIDELDSIIGKNWRQIYLFMLLKIWQNVIHSPFTIYMIVKLNYNLIMIIIIFWL